MRRVLQLGACVAGFSAILVSPAAAQTPLSLAEAIDAAISRSPALHAARATGQQAHELSKAARAEWFPRIHFSESWWRSTQPVTGFGALLNAGRFTAEDFAVSRINAPGRIDGFSRRVGVTEVLFDGGRTRALASISNSYARSADAKRQIAEANIALRATELYGRVAMATAQLRAAEAARAWATEDRSRAEARRRAGTATDADVLASAVLVADIEQRIIQADGDLNTSRAALNSLMGAPLDQAFSVVLPSIPSEIPAIADLTRAARAARAELIDANEAVAGTEASLRLARAGFSPAVAANAGYEWNGIDFGNRQSAWSVGAELRWTLSTGGAEAARAAAARLGLEAARAARDAAIAEIDLGVVTARQQYVVALARKSASRAAADQARESQRIVRERYAGGLASMTDVLAAASATLAADAQETANEVSAVTAWAALQRAVGRSFFQVTR